MVSDITILWSCNYRSIFKSPIQLTTCWHVPQDPTLKKSSVTAASVNLNRLWRLHVNDVLRTATKTTLDQFEAFWLLTCSPWCTPLYCLIRVKSRGIHKWNADTSCNDRPDRICVSQQSITLLRDFTHRSSANIVTRSLLVHKLWQSIAYESPTLL